MAKFRRPSQRTIDLYNQLVQQQNQVRKTLIKMRKQAEETQSIGRLPALVIPKKARSIRNIFAEGLSKAELKKRLQRFWKKYRGMKELFHAGLNSYLSRTVIQGYKDLWTDEHSGIGVKPEGAFGRYTKEQIENSDLGNAMEVYNLLFTHGTELFMDLLYSHKIIEFRWIYDDLHNLVEPNTYLKQQIDSIRTYVYSPKERMKLMQMKKLIGVKEGKFYTGKHYKSTQEKAKKAEEEDEE